jgi:hypothetical protein
MKASKVKAKGYITASLALAILIVCGTAAARYRF